MRAWHIIRIWLTIIGLSVPVASFVVMIVLFYQAGPPGYRVTVWTNIHGEYWIEVGILIVSAPIVVWTVFKSLQQAILFD